MYMKV